VVPTKNAAVKQQHSFTLHSGQTVILGALSLQDFITLQARALAEYKREMIRTWSDNEDLFPPDVWKEQLREAGIKAQGITISDLPRKTINVPKTKGGKPVYKDGEIVIVATTVPYEVWWMSETPSGKMHACWLSMRGVEGQEGTALDDVDRLFREVMGDLEEAAQLVGEISQPTLLQSDGDGDDDSKKKAQQESSRERRIRRRQKRLKRRQTG
jgi:hypothetical protein